MNKLGISCQMATTERGNINVVGVTGFLAFLDCHFSTLNFRTPWAPKLVCNDSKSPPSSFGISLFLEIFESYGGLRLLLVYTPEVF